MTENDNSALFPKGDKLTNGYITNYLGDVNVVWLKAVSETEYGEVNK